MKVVKILGIAGSLRKLSYNKSILREAVRLVPENVELEIFDIEGIPPFNQDLVNGPPERVKELKEKVRNTDAILFATPEYNFSVPGVLKNVIDWVSRANEETMARKACWDNERFHRFNWWRKGTTPFKAELRLS